jgi:hypothetical protein
MRTIRNLINSPYRVRLTNGESVRVPALATITADFDEATINHYLRAKLFEEVDEGAVEEAKCSAPAPVTGEEARSDESHHESLEASTEHPTQPESVTVEIYEEVPEGRSVPASKAELVAELEALGVEFDKRLGVAKLQALLDAEKAARA